MRKFICLLIITVIFSTGNLKAGIHGLHADALDSTNLPTASGIVDKDTVCSGEMVLITVSLTGTGPWFVTGTETVNGGIPVFFSDTIADSVYTFPAIPDPGINEYNIVDIIDIGAEDTNTGNIGGGGPVVVFVHSLPTASGYANPDPLCFGQVIDIELQFTGIGPWLVTGTDSLSGGQMNSYTDTMYSSVFTFPSIPDPGVTYYDVIYIKDLTTGCENIGNTGGGNPLTVVTNRIPDIQVNGLTATDSLCVGGQINLGVHFLHGSSPYMLKIQETAGDTSDLLIPSDTTFILGFADAGEFTFRFISILDNNGCYKHLNYSSNISVFAIPVASLTDFTPVCDTIERLLLTQGSPAGGTYSGRGVYGGYFYPSVAGGPGNYSVTYTLLNGPCSDSKTKPFTVLLCSDLSVAENDQTDFSLYPNPSDGHVTLHFQNATTKATILITGMDGKTIYQDKTEMGDSEKVIDLRGIASGMYSIMILNDKGVKTKKLIIQ